MEINNNSSVSADISNIIANSISKLNLNTASRAFEADKKTNSKEDIKEDFKSEDIALNKDNISQNLVDIDDIQKYALEAGEKLTMDDINYGIMYGRSVIADYSA